MVELNVSPQSYKNITQVPHHELLFSTGGEEKYLLLLLLYDHDALLNPLHLLYSRWSISRQSATFWRWVAYSSNSSVEMLILMVQKQWLFA